REREDLCGGPFGALLAGDHLSAYVEQSLRRLNANGRWTGQVSIMSGRRGRTVHLRALRTGEPQGGGRFVIAIQHRRVTQPPQNAWLGDRGRDPLTGLPDRESIAYDVD